MKNYYTRLLSTIIFVAFSYASFSQSDIYESYVILDINSAGNAFYDLNVDTGNPNFDGANLGTFTPINSLVLNGAQNQTYKCGTHNIMNSFIDYRVYEVGNTPPPFTPSEILFNMDDGTSNFCGGTSLDQTWESLAANIDLLIGLPSGDYILEVYTRSDSDWDGDNIPNTTLYISNGGLNYMANFRVDNPPVANCQNITVQLDASGNASITGSDINNLSTDDFGIASLVASETSFTCADLGTNNVTLTVTDSIGQTDTCVAVVTVEDSVQSATAAITSLPTSPICEGDSITFTATGTDLGISPQYEWFVEGLSVGNNSPTYSTSSLNDGDEVYVEITSISCSTVVTSSNTMIITVNQPPTAEAGPNQTMCSNGTLELIGVFGGSATSGSWAASSGGFIGNIYYPSISGGTVTVFFITNDPPGPCGPAIDSMVITVRPFRAATANTSTIIADCNDTTIQISGNRTGQWTAVSVPAGSSFSFGNPNNTSTTFTGESGASYEITWVVDNLAPCYDESTISVSFPTCADVIDFDGNNDNVDFGDTNNLSGTFSIETWIKPNAINGNIQTILSKRDANDFSTGYDLRLVNNTISFHSNGYNISYNGITSNRWYHVAVTYDGTDYILYVDGLERISSTGPSPMANTSYMRLGAMSRSNGAPINYFNGWMDELRIWNVALSTLQIQEMMNQEIENNTNVRGSVLGLDITGLNWSNLDAYYQMNQGSSDIVAGFLVGDVGLPGRLSNMVSLQDESAPLPYISNNDGNWNNANTWLNGNVQMTPNSNNIDWNIVRTSHIINSGNRETTLLGLFVDSNTYRITNDQSLRITNYLKLDGVLDLVNESQLLQDTGSIVDYSGTGALERDQQGSTNLYHYNYWSSPVGNSNSNYTLDSVLYDGSDSNNPLLAQWTNNQDANGSTIPVTMSSRWLYLYENYPEGTYADWNAITESTSIDVGLGFTMKGSGSGGSVQNYTFRGQPNNGTITTPVTGTYQALVGNPYPSAIDGYTFINDNSSVLLDGTLYFWEQATTSASHFLAQYEGGYAYLNLTGGTAAVSPPEINGVGNATKVPEQYVPVGQGFFVTGNATGGNIQFNNDQRAFVKESSGNSIFLRNADSNSQNTVNNVAEVNNKYIRIDFISPESARRHLLLGFMANNVATNDVDYGYDALNNDNFPNDMSFNIEDEKYVIQGVGDFDVTSAYPLDIDLTSGGTIEIELTDLDNFEDDINVFIYDHIEDTYTQFNNQNFLITLEAGNYSNRFFLVFEDESTLSTIDNEYQNIIVNHHQTRNEIYINTPDSVKIKQVYLVNILGQTVTSWNSTDLTLSNEIRIPIKNVSEGNYILKVETNYSTLNKKIIIKY